MNIRVAAIQYWPRVILNKDEQTNKITLGGPFGEFLHYALNKINISYTVVTPDDQEAGVKRNGSWTGTFGMIQNKMADMVLGPSTITAERMEIVRFSEGLYSEDTAILSARVKRHFYKDVLAQFNGLDGLTYLALIFSTLSVAIFISLEKKVNCFQSFWIVLKAFCSKPIKSKLPLNVSTLLLMVYFFSIILFWNNINQMIGAYMISTQTGDAIKTITDIVENGKIIPSVIRGSSNEYLFKNQLDQDVIEMWQKMRKNEGQGLVLKKEIQKEGFLNSIISKKRVFIVGINYMKILTINFCRMNPSCDLFISSKFLTPNALAYSFRQDFNETIYNKINKMINNLKGMGVIDNWNINAFYRALSDIQKNKGRVTHCVFNSMYQPKIISTIVGLLNDFKPVFILWLYVILVSFIVFNIEIIIKLILLYNITNKRKATT